MDFAHDMSLPSEQLNKATRIAASFFTKPIAKALRGHKAPGVMDFAQIVESIALSPMFNDTRKFHDYPSSMSDFVTLASGIFCEEQIQTLVSQANYFDTIVGPTGISDYFITTRPAIDSIKDIIRTIVLYAATEAQDTNPTQFGCFGGLTRLGRRIASRLSKPRGTDVSAVTLPSVSSDARHVRQGSMREKSKDTKLRKKISKMFGGSKHMEEGL